MTNTISIWLGAIVVGFLLFDFGYLDWNATVFLGRKFLELVEYVAFWR